jgi:choline dehydrogenase-like flavoprotein
MVQPGLNGRNFSFPRGYVIGGSSAISALAGADPPSSAFSLTDINIADNEVYFRGTREDFDWFANVSGDSGWSWNNMQSYIYMARHIPFQPRT